MKESPKIYSSNEKKEFNNNSTVYYSSNRSSNIKEEVDSKTILQKIPTSPERAPMRPRSLLSILLLFMFSSLFVSVITNTFQYVICGRTWKVCQDGDSPFVSKWASSF